MDDGWIYGRIYTGSDLVPFRWPPHGPGKVVELPRGAGEWTVSGPGHWIHGSYYPEDAFLTDVATGQTRKITGIRLPEMSGLVTDDGRVAGSLNELPVLASVSDVEHLPLIDDFVGGDWSMRGVTPDGRLLIGQYYGDRKAKSYTDAAIVWRCGP